jgi:hypothetical protein
MLAVSIRTFRKIIVTLIGIVVILIGTVLIVLPGPAIIIIPLGLSILATEYQFAHRWVRAFQKKLSSTAEYLDKKFGF